MCDQHIIAHGETEFVVDEMGDDARRESLNKIEHMATTPLRVMSFAYAKMSVDDYNGRYE